VGHLTGLGRSLGGGLGAVKPIGHQKQAKHHKHDDENVFDFHGSSLLSRGKEKF
jgi:hypothetical protein